ncbi:Uncharacterised protein [Enterobacter hormaechei]|nr:Uncharacterised protein [Enterobacter hormaechei]
MSLSDVFLICRKTVRSLDGSSQTVSLICVLTSRLRFLIAVLIAPHPERASVELTRATIIIFFINVISFVYYIHS